MILSKQVLVKSSKYYENIGYNISDKYITIDIKDLSHSSRVLIEVQCDYCNNIRSIDYKSYNTNIKKTGKYSCSIKCGILKSKETNIEKYGTDSYFKTGEFKEKSKNTLLEKYGVDHISKVESISESKREKMLKHDNSNRMKEFYDSLSKEELDKINESRVQTNIEKYGVDNISKLDSIKSKKQVTFNKLYGGIGYSSDYISDKIKITNIERYGFEYPLMNEYVKDKIKNTNLERYGYENSSQSDIIKDKIRNTNIEKYGVDNIMLSDDFRKRFIISNEYNYLEYLGDRLYKFRCDYCNSDYHILYDNYYKRKLYGIEKICTICNPISDSQSIKEKELFEFINSIYDDKIITNYRDKLEIDIYLPELNIGFEFNGLYWHSELYKDKYYHINKTNHFEKNDIRIIHIWEDDWDLRREIVKSQIRNWIGVTENKIYARKCYIKEILDSKILSKFLEDNHIQGKIGSSIKLGLYHGDILVSIMAFDNFEGRNKMDNGGYNLSRFCSLMNTTVIGASSKLLKYFINNYHPKRIISFSDRDWSIGSLYYSLGFNLVNTLKPDYKYIMNNKRINKQKFTKSKLVKMGFDENQSESEILRGENIFRIYNTGQLKFELILNL
jgi:hypothetical protein